MDQGYWKLGQYSPKDKFAFVVGAQANNNTKHNL